MQDPTLLTNNLKVLLSWECDPKQVPPIRFSTNQVTLCTERNKKPNENLPEFVHSIDVDAVTPLGEPYDLFDFVKTQFTNDLAFDLVVVTISGTNVNLPYNLEAFNCPTVAIVLDTHHGYAKPLSDILTYLSLEHYDYICFSYCRQHMHWFYACGFDALGWLPLMTMTTFTHEFTEQRERKTVFICGNPQFHPYRRHIIDAINHASQYLSLGVQIGHSDRSTSAKTYASSLVSLNCSLNGDLNLRNLEIISAGGFLLTDKISPQSGFDQVLTPGVDCDVYWSPQELLEKINYYLNHPQEVIERARSAYHKFYEYLHPNYRINDLYKWIFGGDTSSRFLTNYDSRFAISRQYADLLEVRLEIYQQIQELHRLQHQISILIGDDCPIILAIDLVDLCRAVVQVHKQTDEKLSIVQHAGVDSQVQWIEDEDINTHSWDVYLFKNQPADKVKSRFQICLSEENQIVYSGLDKLTNLHNLSIYNKNEQDYLVIRCVSDDGSQYVFNEIFNNQCYPILDFISDVNVIVDVGANIGFSVVYFGINYPDAKIYCFEPDPFAFLLLQDNTYGLKKCQAFPVGLYSDDAIKEFYLGTSSVHNSIHANALSTRRVSIELKQAHRFLSDHNIKKIDLLKLDTEGCEVEILRNIIAHDFGMKVIYLEFHSEADRRIIDQLLTPDYLLWEGSIMSGHRGNLCYVRRDLAPYQLPGVEELRHC